MNVAARRGSTVSVRVTCCERLWVVKVRVLGRPVNLDAKLGRLLSHFTQPDLRGRPGLAGNEAAQLLGERLTRVLTEAPSAGQVPGQVPGPVRPGPEAGPIPEPAQLMAVWDGVIGLMPWGVGADLDGIRHRLMAGPVVRGGCDRRCQALAVWMCSLAPGFGSAVALSEFLGEKAWTTAVVSALIREGSVLYHEMGQGERIRSLMRELSLPLPG